MKENQIAEIVVDLCFHIHKEYGPGLYEQVYESLLCYELDKQGLLYKRQYCFPVRHERLKPETGFKADIVVENKVILELKSVDVLSEVHYKQVITYLKLSGMKLGLLINFNVPLIKNGVRRLVNNL